MGYLSASPVGFPYITKLLGTESIHVMATCIGFRLFLCCEIKLCCVYFVTSTLYGGFYCLLCNWGHTGINTTGLCNIMISSDLVDVSVVGYWSHCYPTHTSQARKIFK